MNTIKKLAIPVLGLAAGLYLTSCSKGSPTSSTDDTDTVAVIDSNEVKVETSNIEVIISGSDTSKVTTVVPSVNEQPSLKVSYNPNTTMVQSGDEIKTCFEATDADGIDRVVIYRNGTKFKDFRPGAGSDGLNLKGCADVPLKRKDQNNDIRVKAWDNTNRITSAQKTIYVVDKDSIKD